MDPVIVVIGLVALVTVLGMWYKYEQVLFGEATVHLQSEHEHFHLHVDMPPHMEVKTGDTVHILKMPDLADGRTEGEMSYTSPVRLHRVSWLQRVLIKNSSLMEVVELVDHP